MQLVRQLVPDWPKLAWVARVTTGSDTCVVFHGPMVETGDEWLVEAVWDGAFAAGDFDTADLVFGTGVRLRAEEVCFVSAATGVDRLWHCRVGDDHFVANSLPALLAVSGCELCDEYLGYRDDLLTAETRGIVRHVRSLPARPSDVNLVYHDNLVFDGHALARRAKPRPQRAFTSFHDYRSFLNTTAAALMSNAACGTRRFAVTPITAISRGYDSPAVSVVARDAGCRRALSIRNASSLLPRSDDGSWIARRLGLECETRLRTTAAYRCEETVWAAVGHAGGLNMTIFDYPQPLSLLFSGSYGDKVWDLQPHDLSEPVGDCDMHLSEFRLVEGVFHCVVPWWGVHQAQEIHALNRAAEMRPWSIGGHYDRPIPRRIAEEAGIPRRAFGRRKLLTASNTPFHWPFSRAAQESFAEYLQQRGFRRQGAATIALLRIAAQIDHLARMNVVQPLGIGRGADRWYRHFGSALIFHWANAELKRRYGEELQAAVRRAPLDAAGAHRVKEQLPRTTAPRTVLLDAHAPAAIDAWQSIARPPVGTSTVDRPQSTINREW